MKVTTLDIARTAGVSQSTVSIVLNNNTKISISTETRNLVIKTAESLGYQFKKHVKKLEKIVVGIVVPTLSDLYYSYLLQNLEIYAKSLGVSTVIHNTMHSEAEERRSFNYLRSIGVQGILVLYPINIPIPEDIPIVVVGEKIPDIEVDTISLNNYTAGMKAAEHLLSLGHQDIAYISTPFESAIDSGKRRMEGILAYMKTKELESRLHVLVAENKVRRHIYGNEYIELITEELLMNHTQCTAIIANNDVTAMGCIGILKKRGYRIPKDMAICGFDNLYIGKMFFLQLTSIDQMAVHGCKVGMSVLLEKVKKLSLRDVPVFIEYEPRLLVRGSTAME